MPENKVVLKNCKLIDPNKIESYISHSGFEALSKVYSKMQPDDVINEIKKSNLRGRGGAGFPTGLKWALTSKTDSRDKFLICNADEGEVGTFKDRYILENDPFSLIEGIIIASYAIDAKKAVIYLRTEYHYLKSKLIKVIEQVKDKGYMQNGAFSVIIDVFEGAGAYVCGEESALMESIEGRRGEARYKPPFPPIQGLWGKPTVINNVETLMNIPRIILNGASWFNEMGTEKSKGTKVFSVSGDVTKPGVYELIMGSPLRELVMGFAGAENIKAIQVGGASGRLLPSEQLDRPLAFESVLGAGAVIVYNQGRNLIDIVRRTMEFFEEESCGKCIPCREGTKRMLEILKRIEITGGSNYDLYLLNTLSETMSLASCCGLGQAAPNVILDSMTHFQEAYIKN